MSSVNQWAGAHVLSTEKWTLDAVMQICKRANVFKQLLRKQGPAVALASAQCLTAFFEPSTRTRLSFESAAHKLGMGVLSVADGNNTTSSKKGESLEDMGRILSGYADVIVLRHPETGAAQRVANAATVPVINAGDGQGEHPTQALIDLFTIAESFPRFQGLHVGLCGDLSHGRTVHSLLRLLERFECKVSLIAPRSLALSASSLTQSHSLRDVLADLDVLYMTRMQAERFSADEAKNAQADYPRLTLQLLQMAKKELVVLHPLPRLEELDPAIDSDPRAKYFEQAANGVPVRMALLEAVLGMSQGT